MTTRVPGRFLSWTALIIALSASVGANVASARQQLGPQMCAGIAPVLTALAVGLLERVSLEKARVWQRVAAWLALGLIASLSFVTSYQHQYALLARWGNPAVATLVLPIAVDGLIVMASVCLSVIAEQKRQSTQPQVADVVAPQTGPQVANATSEDTQADEPARRTRTRGHRRTGQMRVRKSLSERQAEIATLIQQDPQITTAALAERLGITESRVRQLRANGSAEPQPV